MNKFKNRNTGAIVEARLITAKNIEEIALELDLEVRVGGFAPADGMLVGFFNGTYYQWELGYYIMPLGSGIAPAKFDMENFELLYDVYIPEEDPDLFETTPAGLTVTGEISKLLFDISPRYSIDFNRHIPAAVTDNTVIAARLEAIRNML